MVVKKLNSFGYKFGLEQKKTVMIILPISILSIIFFFYIYKRIKSKKTPKAAPKAAPKKTPKK